MTVSGEQRGRSGLNDREGADDGYLLPRARLLVMIRAVDRHDSSGVRRTFQVFYPITHRKTAACSRSGSAVCLNPRAGGPRPGTELFLPWEAELSRRWPAAAGADHLLAGRSLRDAGRGAVTIAALLRGASSYWTASRLSQALETAVASTAVRLDLTNALRQRVQEMAASQRGAWIEWSSGRPEQAQALAEKSRTAAARTHEHLAGIRPQVTLAESRSGSEAIESSIRTWECDAARVFDLRSARQAPEALQLMRAQTGAALKDIETSSAAIIASGRAALRVDREEAASARRLSLAIILAFSALVLLASSFGLWAALQACKELVTT